MTTNTNSTPQNRPVHNSTQPKQKEKKVPSKIVLRAWPSMIFMWPTALVALLAGVITLLSPSPNDMREFCGALFLTVFAVNLIVVAFDFPRSTSLTLLLVGIALLWLFVELNRRFNLIAPLQEFIDGLDLTAASDFYFFIFVIYLLLFITMFITTRFNYWEISSNEIVYHMGLMQDVERYSTDGLRYTKHITDFFEYLLAGSGRLIITVADLETPIVLNNVVRIHRITENLDTILEVKRVSFSTEEVEIVPQEEVIGP